MELGVAGKSKQNGPREAGLGKLRHILLAQPRAPLGCLLSFLPSALSGQEDSLEAVLTLDSNLLPSHQVSPAR